MKRLLIIIVLLYFILPLYSQTADMNFFVQKALENSPVLHKQSSQNQIISLNLKKIETFLTKPQISGDINILFSPILSTDNNKTHFLPVTEGATNYYGYDLAYSDGGQYQVAISFNQPLFNKNRLLTYRKQGEIEKQANDNRILLGRKELKFSVQYQYLLGLLAQKQIIFALENQRLLAQEVSLMEKLVENGIYQPADLQLLKIEKQSYQALSVQYDVNFRSSVSDLLILCGIPDTSINRLQEINLKVNSVQVDSTFINRYLLDSMKIKSAQKNYNLKYKPQISAFADAGLKSIYLPDYKRFGVSLGLSLSYLIYDGKQRSIQQQISKIAIDNIAFEKNNFINESNLRNKKISDQILAFSKQLKIKNQQLKNYDKLLKIYKLQLAQGQISMINFVDILRKISEIKQEKLNLEIQQQIAINILNYWNKEF